MWDVWRVREGVLWAWQDSLLNIYVFMYIYLFTIYKVSTDSTSTNLHGAVGSSVADSDVMLESFSKEQTADT